MLVSFYGSFFPNVTLFYFIAFNSDSWFSYALPDFQLEILAINIIPIFPFLLNLFWMIV